MRKFYIKLFGIVLISALITTGLAFWLIQLYREIEMNPLEFRGFRRYVIHRVQEAVHEQNDQNLTYISTEFRLYIDLSSEKLSYITHPDYFGSEDYALLQPKPILPNEDQERPSNRRSSRNEEQEDPPALTELFDGNTIKGLKIEGADFICILVRQPQKLSTQLGLVALIAGILLTFLILAFMVKRWFVDPLNRLQQAISAFAQNVEDVDLHIPGGDLTRLFQAFHEMKTQVSSAMSDKERLLRDISHDLKSPITRMRMAVELLEDSKVKRMLLNDLADLSSLVSNILESRQGNFRRQRPVQAGTFLKNFLEERDFPIPVKLNIRDDFKFMGNETDLSRIFRNLLENSEKYADTACGANIQVTLQDKLGFILFSDVGSGITNSEIEHIFEPFYKSDTSRRQDLKNGFGLGLSICKQIVETLGGQIHAYPSEENGLSVEMVFPVISISEPAPQPSRVS